MTDNLLPIPSPSRRPASLLTFLIFLVILIGVSFWTYHRYHDRIARREGALRAFDHAVLLETRHERSAALAEFQRALALDPQFPNAWVAEASIRNIQLVLANTQLHAPFSPAPSTPAPAAEPGDSAAPSR